MKKKRLYVLLAWVFSACVSTQLACGQNDKPSHPSPIEHPAGLYEPRNLKSAYAKGTRSRDGNPGPNYWQNRGRYRITILAKPPNRTISGSEQIVYFNESPDTLKNLVIKLFMNTHRTGAPMGGEGFLPRTYYTSGEHIDSFTINGQSRPWRNIPHFITWQPLKLSSPLAPHDSVKLTFRWHYKLAVLKGLPDWARLEGVVDSTTFYLAYFYPRVAVFDDYEGWDTMPYTIAQNFYSDFNDYDVTVRVPAGYVVWGTGNLKNPEEVLKAGPLARYRSSFTSGSTIHIAALAQMQSGSITKSNGMNAWHFMAKNIPDVAFGLSNHYDWDASSVMVDKSSGRRASVQSAYNDQAKDFHHMAGIDRRAVDWLSHHLPGVPFPYTKMTVFQGGAGMEYPMMANDISLPNIILSRSQAEHEISHTYMPFYMGINETRYGFMDEGWAVTFEYLMGVNDVGKAMENRIFKSFRVNHWAHDTSPLADLPIITPGDALTGTGLSGIGLHFNEYGKAALGYLAVRDLLGDSLFRKCLQAYIARWHGKHPSPWDFFYTFNDVSGQNLNWFWNDWFFSRNYIDLAIDKVSKTKTGYSVRLINIGGMDAPVNLVLHFRDGSHQAIHETPAIWKVDQNDATINIKKHKSLKSIDLDGGIWVDANPSNNHWKSD
ncbi:MAG TPA: M1 family metallopeptidase [Balneolales bacterium]|nr:M1 family metallopeptidase [Balneolales bacterium]